MAVVSVKEDHKARRSKTDKGITTHSRGWIVQCDDATDGTAVALTATDGVTTIPVYGAAHPNDAAAKLRSKEAQPDGDALKVFKVTAEYSDERNNTDFTVTPTSRPAEISYDYVETQEEYFKDRSATPKHCTTTAGEPFENNLTRDKGDLMVTIVKNMATHPAATLDEFSNTVNDGTVTIDGNGFAAGTLKMSPIKAVKTVERFGGADVTYYRRTYVLKAKADGWNQTVLNVGFNEKVSGELTPILDTAGLPVRKPYPLQEDGTQAASATTAPFEIEFEPYDAASFAGFTFA